MLSFDHPRGRFNYRAAAVLLDNDRVLLHQAVGDWYWTLPGGRVEFGEASHATIVRELYEEIGVTVAVERPLWLVENFFTLNQQQYHEIAHYFLVSVPGDAELFQWGPQFTGAEGQIELLFRWYPLHQLADLPLYPIFLRRAMHAVPASVEHVTVYDESRT